MAQDGTRFVAGETGETYNDQIVRLFLLAAAIWGVIGMAIGVFAAAQLAWPWLNFDIPWLTFSRIRPLHTLGVIFGFGVSALMGTAYYVAQRTGQGCAKIHVAGLEVGRVGVGDVGRNDLLAVSTGVQCRLMKTHRVVESVGHCGHP